MLTAAAASMNICLLLHPAGQLHKFLARLTETSHGLKGRTVLYLPQGSMADPVAAAADKVDSHAFLSSSIRLDQAQ